MGDFLSGVGDWVGGAANSVGGALSSGVEFFGDISEGLAGIGQDIYEAGRSIVGETSEEAASQALALGERAVEGQAAQVPIWVWIGGGVVLAIAFGLIPNPLK